MATKNLIGPDANKLVIHAHLGGMAYQDEDAVNITGGTIAGVAVEDIAAGAGSVKTVAGKGPDGNGNVVLTHEDVGAAASAHEHAIADVAGLQGALDGKANVSSLSTVATSGSYDDLSDKPSIPAAQVNADWNASSGVAQILNKPALSAVATSGSYDDLGDKPTIPTLAPIADTADIASLSGADTITPGSLGTAAAAAGTISGGTSITFNWSAAVNYTMTLTGNRTLPNPTNVLPGTTRVIVVSSSTSTERTLAFGSNFVGDLPTVAVTNTSNMVLFLYAISATKIVVSGVAI